MMRFEKKYKFNPFEDLALINCLKCYGFSEIYSERSVQSLYYDTNDFDLYHDSVNGIQNRIKIRARFYNRFNKKFNLEYKIKLSELGYKNFPNSDSINSGKKIPLEFSKYSDKKSELLLPSHIEKLYFPKIFINYDRKYFYSTRFNIRITIDKNLKFSMAKIFGEKIKVFLTKPITYNVLEIKYDQKNFVDNTFTNIISNSVNLMLERSSKYCDAVESVYL